MAKRYVLTHVPSLRALLFASSLLLGLLASHNFAQTVPERFWLAGRYDGNRIIVYFEPVKFGKTVPRNASRIAYPIADLFFMPVGLPVAYIARYQQKPGAEHFAIGDRYDLLLGDRGVTTVTLTTLVGFESDEDVGNDSFIGALATPENPDQLLFTRNYYVVRRHVDSPPDSPKPNFDPKAPVVRLDPDPVPFDIQSKAAALVTEQMKSASFPDNSKREAETLSPRLTVQHFTIADGSTRYFVWADWRLEKGLDHTSIFQLAAWMAPTPALHVIAVEPNASYLEKESLLNVVDLGSGRTGIVVGIDGSDGRSMQLMEYRDGFDLKGMRLLHSVGAGE